MANAECRMSNGRRQPGNPAEGGRATGAGGGVTAIGGRVTGSVPSRAATVRERAWTQANVRSTTAAIALIVGSTACGCTSESLRVALEAQQRADSVQQTVFDRQHEGLRILLFRDLLRRLDERGASLNAEQVAAVNAAWNERDLVEFWAVQHERARSLRLAGVDAKLYSDQSILDLLWKSLSAKAERLEQGIASHAGASVEPPALDSGG